jgi:alanine dehydrogenase
MTTSNHLFGNISTIYIATALSPIFRVLRIYHFATANLPNLIYCKSTNYFTTGNRLYNCLLCIEKLYDNFKSPIWKLINDLYGYCEKHNFLATAHLSFSYGASPNYLCTANRPIISPHEIV